MASPWAPTTPSGSRASSRYHWEDANENESYEDNGFGHIEEQETDHFSFQSSQATMNVGTLPPGVKYTQKVPPLFSGRGNWFAYEEQVREWVDTTTIDKEKQGPLLKASLCTKISLTEKN